MKKTQKDVFIGLVKQEIRDKVMLDEIKAIMKRIVGYEIQERTGFNRIANVFSDYGKHTMDAMREGGK